MFEFLRRRPKEAADPLATPQTVAAWFRRLPVRDVIARQQQVVRVLTNTTHAAGPMQPDRIAAIEWLDAALAVDRGQLIKEYADNAGVSATAARRLWQAAYDLCHAFAAAYKLAFDVAVASLKTTHRQGEVPRIGARLMRFYGTDATLRVLRNERWNPAKWVELHRFYMRCAELGIERAAIDPIAAEPGAAPRTIEQEYVAVLLTHLLDTASLGAADIEWAASHLRAWCSGCVLEAKARPRSGFHVDLAGKTGLLPCIDADAASTARYLDTTRILEQLEECLTALRQPSPEAADATALTVEQRLFVLEKLRALLSHGEHFSPDRHPRVASGQPAEVRVGFAQITAHISGKMDAEDAFETSAAASLAAALPAPDKPERTPRREQPGMAAHEAAPRGAAGVPGDVSWKIEDRSATGIRLSGGGGDSLNVVLGALVAVREAQNGSWALGVVRRVNRTAAVLEAGVSIIATGFVRVGLHAKRHAREDMGFVVDGIDVSTIGSRFSGLYLPPPSRPENPVTTKTLIIPTAQYGHGRRIVLITARSVYTVALNKAFEQRPEWTWAAIDVVGKTPRTN